MLIKFQDRIDGQCYVRVDKCIYARLMTEDFMVETWLGWVQGHAGEYLVQIGHDLRLPVSAEHFLKAYTLYVPERHGPPVYAPLAGTC